jgi:hypothetical protein
MPFDRTRGLVDVRIGEPPKIHNWTLGKLMKQLLLEFP